MALGLGAAAMVGGGRAVAAREHAELTSLSNEARREAMVLSHQSDQGAEQALACLNEGTQCEKGAADQDEVKACREKVLTCLSN